MKGYLRRLGKPHGCWGFDGQRSSWASASRLVVLFATGLWRRPVEIVCNTIGPLDLKGGCFETLRTALQAATGGAKCTPGQGPVLSFRLKPVGFLL